MLDIRKHIGSILLICLLSVSTFTLDAQELKDFSNGNLKYLASDAEGKGDYQTAAILYEELSRRKPKNENFKYRMARNLHQSSQYKKAKDIYSDLIKEDRSSFPLAPFYLGRILIMEGNCKDAIEILEQFQKDYRGEKEDRKYRRMAKFSVEACTEGKFEREEEIVIKPLSAEINGSNMEGAPVFESKEKIIYSSLRANPNSEFESDAALPAPEYHIATFKNGEWKEEAVWEEIKLTGGYHAVSGAYNQGKSRFYLSACKDLHTAQMQCDLFRVEIKDGKWSKAEKLDFLVNSSAQERHPAVGVDEKGRETLYFVSDREEGKGGYDIWYSTYYEKKDSYREPKNCGSKVNSVGDEITPFIDPESGVLYFSSDAHPGLGGFDVFRSTGSRSKWIEPINIGSKINSPMDELYYTLDPTAQSGMFVSNRLYGNKKQPCCDDLFYFTDPNLISINFAGVVKDDEGEVLDDATILIYELDDSSGEQYIRKRMITKDDGSYNFRLEPDKKYKVKAEKEGFFTKGQEVSTIGQISSKDHQLNLKMERITKQAFILENIYYDFNEDDLSEKAMLALDTTIFDILVQNPTIIVEIGSHTDSKGRSEYNLNLSKRRAESVVKYLVQKGIRRDRMTFKGYGETQPVAPNTNNDGSDNPEGRAKNRRTEFKVTGYLKLDEEED